MPATPPILSQIARSVEDPVKNLDTCELNESVARMPMMSSTRPTAKSAIPRIRCGCTWILYEHGNRTMTGSRGLRGVPRGSQTVIFMVACLARPVHAESCSNWRREPLARVVAPAGEAGT